MGAEAFTHEVTALTPRAGFEALVKKAQYDYGHAPYNGTISTCEMGRCTKVFTQATPENMKKAYEYVEEQNFGSKWVADYIDLGPTKRANKKHVYLFYGWASC